MDEKGKKREEGGAGGRWWMKKEREGRGKERGRRKMFDDKVRERGESCNIIVRRDVQEVG